MNSRYDRSGLVLGIFFILFFSGIMVYFIYMAHSSPLNDKFTKAYESATISLISKTIIDKQASVENRFSGSDFFFGNGSITKSKTVYYLVAEDGTAAEVGLTDYSRTKVGDKYSSSDWKTM